MPSVADLMVRSLADAGIDNIFGLPGGETVEVLDSIRRSEIEFTLVHRESAAAFMASATARLSRRPSACLSTLGPGATNLVTGVAHAYLDRDPVIAITAQATEGRFPDHTHQKIDLQALFAPVTKASFRLSPDRAAEAIQEALAIATTGRPGPVHLQLGNEIAAKQIKAGEKGLDAQAPGQEDPDSIRRALELLSNSRRPILVAGLGLEPEGPYDELLRAAEALQAPVIVTPKAKGAIPEDHPLFAGTIGLTRTDPVYDVLDQADCVVAMGFDVVELVKPWEHAAPLIWLAMWPNQAPRIPAEVELVGSIGPALEVLAEATPKPDDAWGEVKVGVHRTEHPTLQADEAGLEQLAPQIVLRVLRDQLPREALLTTDVGSHKILACLDWPSYTPNRFLVSNGLSSMGYSLSAAIAAGLLFRDTTVVCTTGDAGLAMSLGELSTLARLEVPVMVVVFKDHALDLIRSHQVRSGKPPFATEFTAPNFVQIAEAHGIIAERVSSEGTFSAAVSRYLEAPEPTLIEVMIDPSTYPTTPAGGRESPGPAAV
jgi:acetolactate synthase-1/2/3 large subunit